MRVLAPLPATFDDAVHDVRQYKAVTDDALPSNTGVLLFHGCVVDGELVGIEDAPDLEDGTVGRYEHPVVLCVAAVVPDEAAASITGEMVADWQAEVLGSTPIDITPAPVDDGVLADATVLVDALPADAREALRRLLRD